MTIEILEPHGFCSGVKAAVEKALHALSASASEPVYCLHELVHNEAVVSDLTARGLRFVDDIQEVPPGARVIFSAHGVSPAVREEATARSLQIIDATCPFVARAHRQARDIVARGLPVLIIGHAGHVEVQGVWGEVVALGGCGAIVRTAAEVKTLPPLGRVGVVCQTTLTVAVIQEVMDALRGRGFEIERQRASEACTATRDRQEAVQRFVQAGGDGVLVLGSVNSSNTRRLAEIAQAAGARAWRVGNVADLARCDFSTVRRLGITAGASTPEKFLQDVLSVLY